MCSSYLNMGMQKYLEIYMWIIYLDLLKVVGKKTHIFPNGDLPWWKVKHHLKNKH